jgi:hypothetical protein
VESSPKIEDKILGEVQHDAGKFEHMRRKCIWCTRKGGTMLSNGGSEMAQNIVKEDDLCEWDALFSKKKGERWQRHGSKEDGR